MSNIQKLANGNTNQKLFANTILTLMNSQGFYQRLFKGVNEMDEDQYELLFDTLEAQKFNDTLDVVLWLET